MKSKEYPLELRLFLILGIIALGWHLLSIFGQFLGIFTDTLIILFLSWILAFIIEPIVSFVSKKGLPKIWASATVYLGIAAITSALILIVLPTTVTQVNQMIATIPSYLPSGSNLAFRVDTFITNSLTSLPLAAGVASGAGGILLVFVFSFYILNSKKEISDFILSVLPNEYEEDFLFIEKTINQTFASFLRAQIFMGVILGIIVLFTLLILGVNYAISTALISAILASIPVLGPFLFVVPVFLASFPMSTQTAIIAVAVVVLAAQLVFNFLAPKILSSELKIHPIIVLLAFILGFKIAGVWGAVFAVPITSAFTIVAKDLVQYWKSEADKQN